MKSWIEYMEREHPNMLFVLVCSILILFNGLANI